MTKKKISIIIPTYNSWKTLKPCIESLKGQSIEPHEIIVVDNASPDGTARKVKKTFKKVKLFEMEENTGVTGGRNKGIKEASKESDYLFFFDHDMIADEKMLEELLKVAESKKKIGIVTPKIYYLGDTNRIWSAGTGMNLWTGQVLFRGGEDTGQYDEVEEVQVAPAAILVKKEVVEKIGGFDDKYFATYEDTDFCFRAKDAGFKVYYAPKAVAWHKISPDPEDERKRLLSRSYWVGRNRVLFMKDFGRSMFVFILFYPAYLGYYLGMAVVSGRKKSAMEFIKGSIDGLLGK